MGSCLACALTPGREELNYAQGRSHWLPPLSNSCNKPSNGTARRMSRMFSRQLPLLKWQANPSLQRPMRALRCPFPYPILPPLRPRVRQHPSQMQARRLRRLHRRQQSPSRQKNLRSQLQLPASKSKLQANSSKRSREMQGRRPPQPVIRAEPPPI